MRRGADVFALAVIRLGKKAAQTHQSQYKKF